MLNLHLQHEDCFSSRGEAVVAGFNSMSAWRPPDIRWTVDEMDTMRVPRLGSISIMPKDPSSELRLDDGVLGCVVTVGSVKGVGSPEGEGDGEGGA